MKNKILLFLTVILICIANVLPVFANDKTSAAIDKIIEYEVNKAAVTDAQAFVDDGLVPYAGTSPIEWFVITLNKYDSNLDFSEYLIRLDEYIENNELIATDYERIALAKAAFNVDEKWIADVIDNQTGKRGIMSIIYGLMISSYGEFDTELTSEKIAEMLIEYQLPDGGFSAVGKASDVDVTAMALQALAPIEESFPDMVKSAKEYLVKNRLDNGGYTSMGKENLESAAQALMAFCAIKDLDNAQITADYILKHQNEDGGFPHLIDTESNNIATYQCLMALVSYDSLLGGNDFIYDNHIQEDESSEPAKKTVHVITGKMIKRFIWGITGFLYVAYILYIIIVKKVNKSKIIASTIIAGALAIAVSFAKIETKSEHYNKKITGSITTTIKITGHDEVILNKTEIPVNDGDSAFTQLMNASIMQEITIDYNGNELMESIYIKSIEGLSEFDYGKNSGWTYTVNGEYPDRSCSAYKLHDGDCVEWIYTEDGGME